MEIDDTQRETTRTRGCRVVAVPPPIITRIVQTRYLYCLRSINCAGKPNNTKKIRKLINDKTYSKTKTIYPTTETTNIHNLNSQDVQIPQSYGEHANKGTL